MRSTAGVALSVVAKTLSVGSWVTGRVARLLRPAPPSPASDGGAGQEDPAQDVAEGAGQKAAGEAAAESLGTVRLPPTEPVPDVPTHVRTTETHIEGLAALTAAEVVAEVPNLSTDELGRLYEHESTHKKRTTVLKAIERAADPRGPAPRGRRDQEPMPEAGGVPTGGGPRR